MKRKILSLFMTLVLVLSFSLVTALPAVADTYSSQETAVLAAADHLVVLQNDDGGFPWTVTEPPSGISYTNVCGVSVMGIMKAWNIEAKPEYNSALAKAYSYILTNPPTYVWDDANAKYTENPKGVDSDPDITFLVTLAAAADADPALLTAVGVPAADILALAKDRWDNRNDHLGSTVESPLNGDATGYALWERAYRHGTDGQWDSLIPWNLGLAVEAALALNDTYSGQGYDQQAIDITTVMYASIDDGTYFSSTDTTQADYIAGLTGAVYAASVTATNQAKAADLLTLLLVQQQTDGSWLMYDPDITAPDPQDTAYAVMALYAEGSDASILAANAGADWLVSTQQADGGWHTYDGAEYAEVDSEAAWALAIMAAGSSLIDLNGGSTTSIYAFEYSVPDLVVATDAIVPVTFVTDALGDSGYDAVRFYYEKTSGPGDVTFTASDGINTYTETNSGYWGPSEGFALAADYSATTDWTLNFSQAGDYTITFSCFEIGSESAPFAEDSVDVTVHIVPPTQIGVSVTPTSVSFGSLKPGVASTGHTITVTNTGNVNEDISASLTNISTPDVYTNGLELSGGLASVWNASDVAVSGTSEPELVLTIPTGTAPGTYTATLVFWAEASD